MSETECQEYSYVMHEHKPPEQPFQRVLAANGALKHLTTLRETEIKDILSQHSLRVDAPVLAGFDEFYLQRGIGFLETIYILIFEEPEPSNAKDMCDALRNVLSPYPGILLSPTQRFRIKVCGSDGTDSDSDEENEATAKRLIRYEATPNWHEWHPPSALFLDSAMVSYSSSRTRKRRTRMPGEFNIGGDSDFDDDTNIPGNQNLSSDGDQRAGRRPDVDANEQQQHLVETGPVTEGSNQPIPSPRQPILSPFACEAVVYHDNGCNGISITGNTASQKLRITGKVECRTFLKSYHSASGLTLHPKIEVSFKELAFQGGNTFYRQTLARVLINVGNRKTAIHAHPLTTSTFQENVKWNIASEVGTAAPPGVIMYREGGYAWWLLQIDDPKLQHSGANLEQFPDKLPTATFTFFDKDAEFPAYVSIQVESMWTRLSGLETREDLCKLRGRRLLNVSHWVQLSVPTPV